MGEPKKRQPERIDEIWDRKWWELALLEGGENPFEVIEAARLERMRAVLPEPPSRTLEVGCGAGRLSAWLARRGYHAFAVERSEFALHAARENFQRASRSPLLALSDTRAVPYTDGTFDAVVSTNLLEHFIDPQPVLNEMVRVLRPGAVFYSDVRPDKLSLFRLLRFKRLKAALGMPEPFERAFTRPELERMLLAAGLADVRVEPMGVYPPLPFVASRLRSGRRAYRVLTALPVWKKLDGKPWAEPLAFAYLCTGRKPD